MDLQSARKTVLGGVSLVEGLGCKEQGTSLGTIIRGQCSRGHLLADGAAGIR